MSVRLERLGIDRMDEVVDVLCDAFRDYPVMRYVLDGAPASTAPLDADRLRSLIGFFVLRRLRQGNPALVVVDDGRPAAAAVFTRPGEGPMPPDVEEARAALWRVLGQEARTRYEAYAASGQHFAFGPVHHHLNMIGVRRDAAGRGLSRPLLEAMHEIASADPSSSGVSLTTELPRNLSYYQHFGYRVVGHAEVGGVETWGLFRENSARRSD